VSDTSGSVLGDQTSMRSAKIIHGEFTDHALALDTIVHARLWNFSYLDGQYNGERFVNITLGDGAENCNVFGKDNGKAFNELTAHGYSFAAIKELERRLREAEAKLGLRKTA
jgi:hypothetical protein